MKKIITLAVLAFGGSISFAQYSGSTNINLSVGNKTAEFGITHTLESEIILGGSFALTDSKIIQDRDNKIEGFLFEHKLNNKLTPTVFALMGGNFKNINLIGKVGATYINQNIRSRDNSFENYSTWSKDKKELYLSVGMELMVQVSEIIGISGSFDNVSGAMIGINCKIN